MRDQAKIYRHRAEECRQIAEMSAPEERAKYLLLAASYERLAEQWERREELAIDGYDPEVGEASNRK
jgi:hypothetical protein